MAGTNFKDGVRSRGIPAEGIDLMPFIGPIGTAAASGGNVYFVDANATGASNDHAGTDPGKPLASLAGAETLVVANRGDVVIVGAGHTETWATLAASPTLAKAGVRWVFQRVGAKVATFTVGSSANTDATLTISAASIQFGDSERMPIFVPGVDSVVTPVTLSGANASLAYEIRDTSAAIEFVRHLVTTAAADNLRADIKVRGFIAGNACVNSVRLVGADGARVNVDFYGVASTAVVEFLTTACHDVVVTGRVYNSGTTDGSKTVVDTATGSTWYADIEDGTAGARYTGGSGSALAKDDVSAITSSLATLQAEVSGAAGVVTWPAAAIPADTAVSLSEVLRQIYAALEGTAANQNGVATWPAAAAPANNVSIAEVLAWINDAIQGANGVVTFPAAAAPANGVALADVIRAIYNAMSYDSAASVVTTQHPFGKHVQKTANMQATQDDLFDVTGQVMLTLLYAEVTAALDGTITTMLARIKTDNVNLCAATTVTSDGDGTMYMASGDTGAVLNGADAPVIRLAQLSGVPLAPILIGNAGVASVIEQILGAADVATGVVVWHAWYIPLEASAAMAASA